MKVQDLISKKLVKYWLENYSSITTNSTPVEAVPSNSGRKSYDGVTWGQINVIMLKDAIRSLPPTLRRCVHARWINRTPLKKTLRDLGLTKDEYYKRCNWAVDGIYYHINGDLANFKDLFKKTLDVGANGC